MQTPREVVDQLIHNSTEMDELKKGIQIVVQAYFAPLERRLGYSYKMGEWVAPLLKNAERMGLPSPSTEIIWSICKAGRGQRPWGLEAGHVYINCLINSVVVCTITRHSVGRLPGLIEARRVRESLEIFVEGMREFFPNIENEIPLLRTEEIEV